MPSGSLDPDPSNDTPYGARPPDPELPIVAIGGLFGGSLTVITFVEVSLSPSLSVIVNFVVYVPGVA